jgi:hypothetical protein
MKRLGISGSVALFALAMAQGACTPVTPGSSFGDGPLGRNEGRLVVDLVDAPTKAVKEIWVTIDRVTAHSQSQGWVTVMNGSMTVDLLKLQSYAQPLGFARLPPGKVTQIRLYTAAAGPQSVVLPDGTQLPLKTPSGTQSGIKIHGPWDIGACQNTMVTLDFDGHKSIWVHPTGHEELWILRPVIRVKRTEMAPAPCTDVDAGTSGEPDGGLDEGPGDGDDGAGGGCASGTDCLSGACAGGQCQPGGPGAPCRKGADCASTVCQDDGTCDPGSAGPSGGVCETDAQCLSNGCEGGLCQPGGQGTHCAAPSDCAEGFSCSSGACEPDIG